MIFQPGRKGKAPWPQRIAPSTNPLDENGAASKNDCLGHGTLWPQRTMTKFAVRCEEEINPLRRCHHLRSPLPPCATSVVRNEEDCNLGIGSQCATAAVTIRHCRNPRPSLPPSPTKISTITDDGYNVTVCQCLRALLPLLRSNISPLQSQPSPQGL
ncbi:DUF4127 domain-containing protein [Sesbania bispinosa]|nr:DUF4127 domain-containing protein [Sesbania bispinosa]